MQNSIRQQYAAATGHPELRFNIDSNGLLVRHFTIADIIQTVVPEAFQVRLLYLARPPPVAVHRGQRSMYDSKTMTSTQQ